MQWHRALRRSQIQESFQRAGAQALRGGSSRVEGPVLSSDWREDCSI